MHIMHEHSLLFGSKDRELQTGPAGLWQHLQAEHASQDEGDGHERAGTGCSYNLTGS